MRLDSNDYSVAAQVEAAKLLRRKRISAARPTPESEVQVRPPSDYDTALGVDLDGGWPDEDHQDHFT